MTDGTLDHPTQSHTATETAALWRVAVYLVLGGLAFSPLFQVAVPALVDYPNHLARMGILAHQVGGGGAPVNYVPAWRLFPNLAMDLVIPPLAHIMPLEAAGRLFIGVTLALLVAGTAALHRVLYGRIGLWPLCSLLFLYNAALYWGFLNYLFGLGVALIAFSGWIASEGRNPAARVAAFALVASLVFVLHLFAFGVYGLLVSSYEIGRLFIHRPFSPRRAVRPLALAGAPFVLPGALWLLSLSSGGLGDFAFGGMFDKFYAFEAPLTFGRLVTATSAMALAAAMIALLALISVGIHRGMLRVAPAMRLPLIVLTVAALAMPNTLYGSWQADIRLPVALPFVFIASTRLDASRRLLTSLAAAAALLFLGVRVWGVTENWREMDRRFGEFRLAARDLPQGARLLIVQSPMRPQDFHIAGVPLWAGARLPANYWHMGALAVLDRDAFIPYLFTTETEQPLRPAPRNEGRFQDNTGPLWPRQLTGRLSEADAATANTPTYVKDWPDKFEFVLWIDFGVAPADLPNILEPWASGSFFHIYRIARP